MPNLPLNFAEILFGGILLHKGLTSAGQAFQGGGQAGTGGGSVAAAAKGGYPAAVDPLPGATASRLDQGIDFTGTRAVSPWDGTVVYSNASDPGWRGGGYVAVQSSSDPSKVFYLAEGWTPIVAVGDAVKAGQDIATPRSNPYNGIVGNGEAGLADPNSPGRPLAQVTADAAGMVTGFYNWLLSLGGPKATSTSNAGSP